jgi:hypothetical protein
MRLNAKLITKISYWITIVIMEPLIVGSMQYLYWVNPRDRVYEEWHFWTIMGVSIALLVTVFQAFLFIWIYFTDKERFIHITKDAAELIYKEAPPEDSLVTVKYSYEAHQASDRFIKRIKTGVIKPPSVQMSDDR